MNDQPPFLIGLTGNIGTGKSFLALQKIIKSLVEGLPCALVDPKGELYWLVIAYLCATIQGRQIWEQFKHKILFLNPVARGDYLMGFNAVKPLHEFRWSNPDLTALLAMTLTEHVKHQSGYEFADANRMKTVAGHRCIHSYVIKMRQVVKSPPFIINYVGIDHSPGTGVQHATFEYRCVQACGSQGAV